MAKDDSEQRGPSRAVSWLLGLTLVLGCAISGLVAFGGMPTPSELLHLTASALVLLGFLVGGLTVWQFAILWHELGHLVAGLAVGMRLSTIRVGLLEIYRSEHGLKLRFDKSNSLFSGHCGMRRNDGLRTIWGETIEILGGPVASLILFLLFVWVATVVNRTNTGLFQLYFCFWTFCLGVLALLGFIPLRWRCDMSILRELWTVESRANLKHFNTLNVDVRSGKRPRDWNLEAAEHVLSQSVGPEQRLYANHVAYYAYWDRGDGENALARISAAAIECTELTSIERTSKLALLEYAFALARIKRDHVAAESALETVMPIEGDGLDHIIHRISSAISLAKGDWNSALSEGDIAIKAVQKELSEAKGATEAELEWITAIVEEAKAGVGTRESIE